MIKSVYGVYVIPNLVTNPLKAGVGSGVVHISVYEQSWRFRHHDPVLGFCEYMER